MKKILHRVWPRRNSYKRSKAFTPLLLSERSTQRALTRERDRADRTASPLATIKIYVDSLPKRQAMIKMAKLLHKKLRKTDEKGQIGLDSILVLLPATHQDGLAFVCREIHRMAESAQLSIRTETAIYPEIKSDKPFSDNDIGLPRSRRKPFKPIVPEPAMIRGPEKDLVGAGCEFVSCSPYPRWKRAMDISISSVGLIFAAPVIGIAALAVKINSPGPAFFRQKRTGYRGTEFVIYKLRTMVINAEEIKSGLMERNERDGPAFKMKRDPRTTTVGRFLRATGLDELPQLWNVLIGDMALVGPRPLPCNEANECHTWQRRRMDIKPGLTCFWQVTKTPETSFAEWMRLDLKYSENFGFTTDLRLLFRTVLVVILGRAGH